MVLKIPEYDDAKLDSYSPEKLMTLRKNAAAQGVEELILRCDERLAAMNIRKRGTRSGKSDDVRNLELEGDNQLLTFAAKINAIYDLSQATAKAESKDVKRFIARNLLGKSGASKVGGHQTRGIVAIDRYISYAIGEHVIGLGLILAQEQPVEAHKWFVSCLSQLMSDRVPVHQCVPGMDAVEDHKNQGIAYDDFKAAAEKFTELLDQIAPKKIFA